MKLIPIQINEDGEIIMVMPDTIIEDGDIMVTGDGVHLPIIHVRGESVIERLDVIEDNLGEQTARVTELYVLLTEHKHWIEHVSGRVDRLEKAYYSVKQENTIPDQSV